MLRRHVLVLHREPGAGAADAGLHLIGDQQAVKARELLQVARRCRDHPAFALDRLDDHGCGLVGEGGHRAVVEEPHAGHQRLERRAFGRLPGQGQRAHGPAVEAAVSGVHERACR